jgi:hypothetical protein
MVSESGFDRTKMIQPEVMVSPLLWLVSDTAASVTGRRFLGVHWDPELPPNKQPRRQARQWHGRALPLCPSRRAALSLFIGEPSVANPSRAPMGSSVYVFSGRLSLGVEVAHCLPRPSIRCWPAAQWRFMACTSCSLPGAATRRPMRMSLLSRWPIARNTTAESADKVIGTSLTHGSRKHSRVHFCGRKS